MILPLTLGVWILVLDRRSAHERTHALLLWLVSSGLVTAGYVMLRMHAGAFSPLTAPSYYRFTLEPRTIVSNILEYTDRAMTLPAIATIVGWLILRDEQRPRRTMVNRAVIWCGLAWLVGGYALTVFLPVRSSLYACVPSVGACLVAAALLQAWWLSAPEVNRQRCVMAALAAALIAAPIHYTRAARLVREAELSNALWTQLPALVSDVGDGSTVVIHDDANARPNVSAVFGNLLDDAYELRTGRRLHFTIEPFDPVPCDGCVAKELVFSGGAFDARRDPTALHGTRSSPAGP